MRCHIPPIRRCGGRNWEVDRVIAAQSSIWTDYSVDDIWYYDAWGGEEEEDGREGSWLLLLMIKNRFYSLIVLVIHSRYINHPFCYNKACVGGSFRAKADETSLSNIIANNFSRRPSNTKNRRSPSDFPKHKNAFCLVPTPLYYSSRMHVWWKPQTLPPSTSNLQPLIPQIMWSIILSTHTTFIFIIYHNTLILIE